MKESTNIETGYVCYCKQVTEEDLRESFHGDPRQSFAELVEKTGVATQCAACEFEVRSLYDDWRAEHGIQAELDQNWKHLETPRLSLFEYLRKRYGPTEPNFRNGLFALRDAQFETCVVVSNLNFPENDFNPNGPFVKVTAEFYHADGRLGGRSRDRTIPANGTVELSLKRLFPKLPDQVMGAVYLDFHDIHMTNSLRAYGVLYARDGQGRTTGRCHYHDKFAKFIGPGFFQTAWPFAPGQECWMAACNCMEIPYRTEAMLKTDTDEQREPFELAPMASRWLRVGDIFGQSEGEDPSLFYLENPQHVMVWFFWKHLATGAWIAQHH